MLCGHGVSRADRTDRAIGTRQDGGLVRPNEASLGLEVEGNRLIASSWDVCTVADLFKCLGNVITRKWIPELQIVCVSDVGGYVAWDPSPSKIRGGDVMKFWRHLPLDHILQLADGSTGQNPNRKDAFNVAPENQAVEQNAVRHDGFGFCKARSVTSRTECG